MNEWDEENVVMCGGSDGVVRIYSIEMVEGDNDSCAQTEHPSSLALQSRLYLLAISITFACLLSFSAWPMWHFFIFR